MIVHQKSSPDPSNGLLLHQDFSVNSHNPGRLTSFLVLLGQVVIILAGLIGAGYTFLTSFSIPHYPLILLPSLFFCTFYWSFLLTRKSPFLDLIGTGPSFVPCFLPVIPHTWGIHCYSQQYRSSLKSANELESLWLCNFGPCRSIFLCLHHLFSICLGLFFFSSMLGGH